MALRAIWFEPVNLIERCSLSEALLWLLSDGQRPPIDNDERDSIAFENLPSEEREPLGVPSLPRVRYRVSTALHITKDWLENDLKAVVEPERSEKIAFGLNAAAQAKEWQKELSHVILSPSAKLFAKLMQCSPEGRLLPADTPIADYLAFGWSGEYDHLKHEPIADKFWENATIDWVGNTASSGHQKYVDISLLTERMLIEFPGTATTSNAQVRGQLLTFDDHVALDEMQARRARGRPEKFDWTAFHVQVASLYQQHKMPADREGGIQTMLHWFRVTKRKVPSHSAVAKKMTEYYRGVVAEQGNIVAADTSSSNAVETTTNSSV